VIKVVPFWAVVTPSGGPLLVWRSHLLLLADEIERAGVRLEFITQDIDQTAEGKLFFAVRGAVAQYEKAKIKDRMLRGKQEKARQGRVVNPGKLPVWLRMAADGRTVELDQDWTEVVRLVYHLFVDEGLTLRRIAQRLAMLGQPTPSGGCQWQISTLHDWLRNPAAKGELYQLTHRAVAPKRRRKPTATTASHSSFSSAELRPREEWYLVPVPPAVDENAWATAQRRLDQNRALARRNGRRAYLLSGLVTCESCGRRMTGFYRAATGKRFYQCQHQPRVDGTGACRSPAVRAEPLEHAVWERMSELIRQPELLKGELARRSEAGSPTQDGLLLELRRARARLDAVPRRWTVSWMATART
jgi:site-specific DNA recombinase